MKNNIFSGELIASFVLIAILILLFNPLGLWMPNGLSMMMLLGLIVVFAVFASFVWKEKARDERESMHRMFAGRVAFLAGSGTLVLAIVVESFQHALDFWLVLTLVVMVITKVVGMLYSQMKH